MFTNTYHFLISEIDNLSVEKGSISAPSRLHALISAADRLEEAAIDPLPIDGDPGDAAVGAIGVSGVDHPVLELVAHEAALSGALLQLVRADARLLGARGHVREAPAVVDHEAHHKVQPHLGRALGDGDGARLVPVPAALGAPVLADLGREVPAGGGRSRGAAEGVPAGAGAGVVAAGNLVGALGGLGVGVPPRDVLEVGDVPDPLGGERRLHFVAKEVDAVGAFGLGEHLHNYLVRAVGGGKEGEREKKCAVHYYYYYFFNKFLFLYIY